MLSMSVIITSLAAVTAALVKEPLECNFIESTKHQRCFGAVGHRLLFHLHTATHTEIVLTKDDVVRILKRDKKQLVSVHHDYDGSILFKSGTVTFSNVLNNYSGDYLLNEYNYKGVSLRKVQLHLEIQAPVSKPVVSQVCLSPKQTKVSCYSECDGCGFLLYLDDILVLPTLGHAPHTSEQSVSTFTVSLHGQITGNLKCTVFNNISREETFTHLKSCRENIAAQFPSLVIIIVASAAVSILVFVVVCLSVKHLLKKTTPAAVDEVLPDSHEDDIVYSSVMIRNTKTNPSNILNIKDE